MDTGERGAESAGTAIFLHSGVGHSRTFRHQIDPMVARGFRFLAYDRPGCGNSPLAEPGSAPPEDSGLLRLLLSARGVDQPVHLVGAAAGGRTAVEYALAHPDGVASLTLVCSLAGIAEVLYPAGTSTLLPPEFLALPAYLRELGPVYRGENPTGTADWRSLIADRGRAEAAGPAGGRRAVPEHIALPARAEGFRRAGGAKIRLSDLAVLARSGGPEGKGVSVHLIAGGADPYVTPPAYRRLAAGVPGATLRVIAEAGHSPYWECPVQFNEALLEGLSQATPEGARG
ncbi:alpha/beta hydrolase [Arthrobacter sp. zg-Y1219]|uniref:alpha/beta fold hydrolase n=1 Tax=Arthrobacter sp. zg-Y1219 TaxID=3049067 RepID=UPI0024C32288|nr:alpha/beta hydrolase [Arthrobacter sp. zg-Y1219]MDK1361705.1 alpha/beta hydrolase [Arthrobacter sp. zg-Y1219]